MFFRFFKRRYCNLLSCFNAPDKLTSLFIVIPIRLMLDGIAALTFLKQTKGSLSAIFNNGAFALPGALEDIPSNGMKEIFEANFFGWHYLIRKVLPVMRAQGYGRIIQCCGPVRHP